MYIQCTQKLLAKIKLPHGKPSNPPKLKYCWHASFFEQYDFQYVVMMNDATGEELFFSIDSFQDFDKQVLEEIELDMEDSEVPAQEIKAYMQKAGPLTFGPTRDRSAIAQLNGYTRRMKDLIDKMHDLKDILEDEDDLDTLVAQFNAMIDTLADRVEKIQPKPKSKKKQKNLSAPIRTLMIELDVELKLLGDTKVKRSFLLPIDVSFEALHVILQIGFDWSGLYPHSFDFSEHGFKLVLLRDEISGNGLERPGVHDEETTMLSDLLPAIGDFSYLYGLDNEWEHTIKVGKVEYRDCVAHAECTGGKGSVPPEDCGGPSGFEDLRLIFNGPLDDEDHEVRLSLLGDNFDQDLINEEMEDLVFTFEPL